MHGPADRPTGKSVTGRQTNETRGHHDRQSDAADARPALFGNRAAACRFLRIRRAAVRSGAREGRSHTRLLPDRGRADRRRLLGTVVTCGSEEQKRRWLPAMSRFEKIGAFALTEPHGGSDVAGGMETTARREGDEWVINGAKRWIGNATFADLVVVWARDVETNRVLGFVVEKGTPGFTATKIENKFALRIVQNADIVLDECRVPEANRLQNANSFRDTAEILRRTRSGVAWQAVGVQFAAYELALQYAKERTQFGRPIGKFQMVQDLLVKMLGNATACAGMMARLAQLQHEGVYRDEQSALAKAYCTSRMRETVHWARELLGGNGIVLDYNIGRFVADSEALYSYEGTREMQTLIVGKSVTGLSAFV